LIVILGRSEAKTREPSQRDLAVAPELELNAWSGWVLGLGLWPPRE
jgi:hypothetical protein